MIETRQLLHIVAIVESVRDGSSLRCGDVVSLIFKLVIQPSSTMQMRQWRWLGSCHPWRMTSLSKVTLQLVALKNTSQPASQRTATDRRLLVRLGKL